MAEPTPALPLGLATVSSASVDEVTAELKKSPFFATSAADIDPDNPEYEAFRALQYEGTRLEIAEGFRENGNEMARAKKWADGKEYYTKALEVLKKGGPGQDIDGKELEGIDREKEINMEKECEEKCLVNRALCHLELKNYRSCNLDCQSALLLSPSNIKAHYRLAQAQLALKTLSSALAAAQSGLSLDPTNTLLKTLLQKIQFEISVQESLTTKRLAAEDLKRRQTEALRTAFSLRKIRTRTTAKPPDLEDANIRLVPDPLDPKLSTLTFPVLMLYPLHEQSDFIKAFGEEQMLQGHLEYLLPLPWDTKHEYTVKDVEVYAETGATAAGASGGLVKYGKKVPLLKLLSGSNVEVVDGIVKVNIVPKARAGEWIETVKKRMGKV
ncbi:MAG: hypothetical protein MMC33_005009 [Icmadophila ericetorum]|nr:hypothetical protein [Icmadophila ericetorum]